ncbi:MAG: hypothetical protein ACRERE_43825 [Candidatus Entotheonellia bacterium]
MQPTHQQSHATASGSVGQIEVQVMSVTIRRVGVEQAHEVLRIMRLAFEEYRGRLVPPSGALTETVEDVRTAISGGGTFR